jgi:hypothetical protein
VRALILLTAAAFAIVHMMATATAAPQEERAASPIGAILALDTVVQKRFEHVARGFGLSRITSAHGFRPETDAEISSVRELEEARLTVALYLGGRDLLARKTDPKRDSYERIEGPVVVTRGRFPSTIPSNSMLAKARRAFAAFEQRESQDEFAIETWTVVARPVRANGTCLKCHRSTGGGSPYDGEASDLRVGDVLGVVFYAYQPATASR